MPEAERRRIGRVAHDERGNAYLTWRDAPRDHQREVLEILGDPGLKPVKKDHSYDPYARHDARVVRAPPAPRPPRTDLRKLGEWLKMMKELEGRKRNSGHED